ESYQQQLQEWEDARRKKDDDNERLPKPRRSFYYIQSTTLEALPEALQTRQSIIWIADELRGLFGALNQYKAAGRGDDRQALLSLYDGQVIDILRKSGQIHLPRAFVSILGGIQPSVLVDVINRDKDVVDGLFARLSCVHVPITELPPTGTFNRVDIQNLLEGIYRRLAYDSEPQTFRLSPGALQVLNEWEQACERLKKAEPNGFIRALYPKARQRAARVALVLHCLNAAYHNLEPTPDIPASTMQAAVTFTHWLLAQTKAVYAESGHGQSPEAIRISKFVQRFQGMEVTPKMVRAWWSGSKKPSLSAIREFMQKLVSLGCATVAKGQPEGDGFAIFIPPGVTRGDWGGDYGLVTPEVPTGTAFSPGVTKVTNDLGNSDLPGNDGEDRKILVTPTDHNPKRPIDETFRGDYALSHPLVTPQASSQPVSPPKPDPNLPTDLIASGENDDEWDYIDLD
ncbi:MAG: YfjI family protein, partial [Gloeomargarita sp. SKYB31]|nr:YfjI family protein [Gloeomargarita sp. SKYB31]